MIAQVVIGGRACKCNTDCIPTNAELVFSQLDAQDVHSGRDRERDDDGNGEIGLTFFYFEEYGCSTCRRNSVLTIRYIDFFRQSLPKTDLIIDPRRWRISGDRL